MPLGVSHYTSLDLGTQQDRVETEILWEQLGCDILRGIVRLCGEVDEPLAIHRLDMASAEFGQQINLSHIH